ncbi:ATP-dependent RNA helicase HrpA [Gammaproteobacteria bacterium]
MPTSSLPDTLPPPIFQNLARSLQNGMLADRRRLSRRLEQLRHAARNGQNITKGLKQLEAAIQASVAQRALRETERPIPTYPDELPVSVRRADIAAALRDHQVVIVAGETGSGKTTQLPKICLELGRGVAGLIGCTQPRRIAATSVATRVARELGGEVGGAVGYQVRFAEQLGPATYIKFMTDGILLAETQNDRGLYTYDTLIIDEAHERSLNIDFLLGYLKRLLPRRPELKVIVSSATLDTERFAAYFGDAPIVAVEGRTYPVEVRYRPPVDNEDTDLPELVADAVEEVLAEGRLGDVLVFLSGEREIREAAVALSKRTLDRILVLPLYARLTAAEQARVFQRSGLLQIVLATNVAETSLTIPGIRTVIDTGLARINRYSPRSQVSRLRIEPISRASADQRKGRCGRVGPGVCVRLYEEADYLGRPAYTDPEIKRTSLAAVILQMKALGLGDPEDFPFIEPPHSRLINEGYQTLQELQALDTARVLTDLGRNLARLPVDPRLGRMVLAASGESALQEVLTIASALSIQDPRERPLARRDAADEKHRRFHDERSDFVAWLKLWEFYGKVLDDKLSKNAMRRFCHEHFLSYNRMLEWSDLRAQLADVAAELKLTINPTPASYEALHRALLTGLLSRIGMLQFQNQDKETKGSKENKAQQEREKREKDKKKFYLGARGIQFFLFPGSGLFAKFPRWLVASEIMETTKVYARFVARIEPEWLEALAQHLVRRSYGDPHWEKRQGRVVAIEQVTLYGLPIVTQRRVDYGPIDPILAREVFLRSALVRGDYATNAPFFRHNQTLVEEIEELEHKSRRRDVLVDEQIIHAFYDERLPEEVLDHGSLETWRREAERQNPRILYLDRDTLMREAAATVTAERFPDHLTVDGADLMLTYRFEPNAPDDGVTLEVPVALLPRLQDHHHDYLVPGLLAEKLTFLFRALPKSLRVNFIPIPDYVRAAYETFADPQTRDAISLPIALSRFLQRLTGIEAPPASFRMDELPTHLRMGFRVLGDDGQILAEDRDLNILRTTLGERAEESFRRLAKNHYEREAVTAWDFGPLLERVELPGNGVMVYAYPALAEEENGRVALRLFDTIESAATAHCAGLRRLFALQSPSQIRYLERNFAISRATALAYTRQGGAVALKQEILTATLDAAFLTEDPNIRDADTFQKRLVAGRARFEITVEEITRLVTALLAEYHQIAVEVRKDILVRREAYEDLRSQLDALVYPGFISVTPIARLRQYPRYLKAMVLRLEKMRDQPLRDRERMVEISPWWIRFQERIVADRTRGIVHDPKLEELRWMLEEWRVSLFAQELKAAIPVSGKRVEKMWMGLGV